MLWLRASGLLKQCIELIRLIRPVGHKYGICVNKKQQTVVKYIQKNCTCPQAYLTVDTKEKIDTTCRLVAVYLNRPIDN